MRVKVYQKDTSPNGDCLKACLCSLFGWNEYFVPNFGQYGAAWREHFVDYMASKNIGVISFPIGTRQAETAFCAVNKYSSFQCIVAVQSFKYPEQNHAVIGRVTEGVLEIIHDVNPENAGKTTEDYKILEVLVFFRSF